MAQSAQAIILRGMALAGSAITQGIGRLEDLVPGFSSTKWPQILHARHQQDEHVIVKQEVLFLKGLQTTLP